MDIKANDFARKYGAAQDIMANSNDSAKDPIGKYGTAEDANDITSEKATEKDVRAKDFIGKYFRAKYGISKENTVKGVTEKKANGKYGIAKDLLRN